MLWLLKLTIVVTATMLNFKLKIMYSICSEEFGFDGDEVIGGELQEGMGQWGMFEQYLCSYQYIVSRK